MSCGQSEIKKKKKAAATTTKLYQKRTVGKQQLFKPLSERQDNVTHVKNNERATGQETKTEKYIKKEHNNNKNQIRSDARKRIRVEGGPFIDFHIELWTFYVRNKIRLELSHNSST